MLVKLLIVKQVTYRTIHFRTRISFGSILFRLPLNVKLKHMLINLSRRHQAKNDGRDFSANFGGRYIATNQLLSRQMVRDSVV